MRWQLVLFFHFPAGFFVLLLEAFFGEEVRRQVGIGFAGGIEQLGGSPVIVYTGELHRSLDTVVELVVRENSQVVIHLAGIGILGGQLHTRRQVCVLIKSHAEGTVFIGISNFQPIHLAQVGSGAAGVVQEDIGLVHFDEQDIANIVFRGSLKIRDSCGRGFVSPRLCPWSTLHSQRRPGRTCRPSQAREESQ